MKPGNKIGRIAYDYQMNDKGTKYHDEIGYVISTWASTERYMTATGAIAEKAVTLVDWVTVNGDRRTNWPQRELELI